MELGVLNSPDLKATPEEIRSLAKKVLKDTPESTDIETLPMHVEKSEPRKRPRLSFATSFRELAF